VGPAAPPAPAIAQDRDVSPRRQRSLLVASLIAPLRGTHA
jgi:hypothetical protein